jgi:hypothetical protein
MKLKLLIIGFTLLCLNGYSQESTLVKGKGYIGYAFNKEHFVFMSIDNQKERYTPTKEDIIKSEIIVNENIDSVLKKHNYCNSSINQNTLKKYKRQYVGFRTNNGDIVIWINLLKNKDINDIELSKDIVTVLDGGDKNWCVFVNLTKGVLYGIRINGIS